MTKLFVITAVCHCDIMLESTVRGIETSLEAANASRIGMAEKALAEDGGNTFLRWVEDDFGGTMPYITYEADNDAGFDEEQDLFFTITEINVGFDVGSTK